VSVKILITEMPSSKCRRMREDNRDKILRRICDTAISVNFNFTYIMHIDLLKRGVRRY